MLRILLTGLAAAVAALAYPNPDNGCEITTPSVLGTVAAGSAGEFSIVTNGCTGPYFTIARGTVPAGMALNEGNGQITGQPTTPGVYAFTVRARSAGMLAPSRTFVLTVSEPLRFRRTILASAGEAGSSYSDGPAATGGVGAYTYTVTGGGLPSGLTINASTGVISGTISSGFTTAVTFTVTVTDSASTPNTFSQSFQIVPNPAMWISTATLPNGRQGQAYSADVDFTQGGLGTAAAGGFSVVNGALPAGLTINASTGVISGTPTAAGWSTFTVRYAVQSGGNFSTAWRTYLVAISNLNDLQFDTGANPPAGETTFAYRAVVTPVGGVGPYTFAVSGGALPSGWVLDGATGAIYGETTSGASASAQIGVTDATGATYSESFNFTQSGAIVLQASAIDPVMVNASFSQNPFVVTNGVSPLTYRVEGGALPPGLTMNATTGLISGTPTSFGDFYSTISVSDAAGGYDRVDVQFSVDDELRFLTTSPMMDGYVGSSYANWIDVIGGSYPYDFEVSAGALPPGLELFNGEGTLISGTPTTSGTYNFTLRVTDDEGRTATRAYTITVGTTFSILTQSPLRPGRVEQYYSEYLDIGGGVGYVDLTVSAGALPPGLGIGSGGQISGYLSAPGTYNFTIRAADSTTPTQQVATRDFTIVVSDQIVIAPTSIAGTVGRNLTQQLTATNGVPPVYFYSDYDSPETLPPDLGTARGGLIHGVPAAAGSTTATIFVNDNLGTGFSSLDVIIRETPLVLVTATLPNGTVGESYGVSLTSTGGVGDYYTYYSPSDSLPPGLSINSGGNVYGEPTTPGTYTFTLRVTDDDGRTDTREYTVQIAAAFSITTPTALPAGGLNAPYSQTIATTGGRGPVRFRISGGSPPPTLGLDPLSGVYSGVPGSPGSFEFVVEAIDADGRVATRGFTQSVGAAPVLGPNSIPNGDVGQPYSAQFTVTGGTAPFTYTLATGTLPAGLTLAPATGLLSGTPTTPGDSQFSVLVTDAGGLTSSRAYSVSMVSALTITTGSPLPAGEVSSPYSQAIAASGGTSPYSFAVTAGAVPAGLTLSSGGVLSGTPTGAGTANFTVTVSDGAERSTSKAFQLVIYTPFSITNTSLPNGTTGSPYSVTIATAGAVSGATISISAGTLPTGLTISSGGAITGTPTQSGSFPLTFRAVDGAERVATKSLTMTVLQPFTITTSSLATGVVGSAYTDTIASSGGVPTVTYSISAGALPAGLTLSSGGAISGSPTAAGTASFTVQGLDGNERVATKALSITVNASLSITTATLPAGTVSSAYSATIAAAGGTGTITRTVETGSLPAGLSMSSAGVITGTPTAAGTSNFAVSAVDEGGHADKRDFSITVNAQLVITTTELPHGSVSAPYSATVAATGGTGTITRTVASGSLPAGLAMSTAGVITGTPTTAGVSNFAVSVADEGGHTAQRSFSITVDGQLVITTAELPAAVINTTYTAAIAASGGSGTVTFSLATGTLPAGLTLGSNGQITGTATETGESTFTVQAMDARERTATKVFTLRVVAAVRITTESLPAGTAGAAYTATLAAEGGIAPYTWTLSSGELPASLALNEETGAITGNVVTAGSFALTFRVTDARENSFERSYVLVTTTSLSLVNNAFGVEIGAPFTTQVTATGGRAPYTFALLEGGLPPGLGFNAPTATISGTPTALGSYSPQFRVTDGLGNQSTGTIRIEVRPVAAPEMTLGPDTLPNGVAGVLYDAQVVASSGTAPYTYGMTQGSLPPGVLLHGDGRVTGTPTAAGTFTVGILATDSSGRTAGRLYRITIVPAAVPLVISPATLPGGVIGQPYEAGFTVTGGTAPYTVRVGGSLPPGIVYALPANLTGTPTTPGAFAVTVSVTDAAGATATRNYSLAIAGRVEVTTSDPLPEGVVGQAYPLTFSATGGVAPYTFAISGLPAGLTGGSNGAVAGTPTAAGTFSVGVEVTDSRGDKGARSYALVIRDRLQISGTPGSAPLPVGVAVNAAFAATGGRPPYNWSVTGGSLPPGVSLDATSGALTGTPTTAGAFPVTVTVRDQAQGSASSSVTIRVGDPLSITTSSLAAAQAGVAYTASISAAGGVGPYTFAVTAGALPGGVTLAASGALSGTPAASGSFGFTAEVTDSTGAKATRALSLTVGLPPLPPPNVTGVPAQLDVSQQSTIGITLGGTYPAEVRGTITMSFTADASNPIDDPAVQFTSGGRSVDFVIPAGETSARFPIDPLRFQSGTIAGTIRLRFVYTPAGGTTTQGDDLVIVIPRKVPVITRATLATSGSTLTVVVEGVTNTREASQMTLQFNAASGGSIQTSTLTVDMAAAFQAWFASSAASPFGGQFRVTLPLTVSGDVTAIESVDVRITNGVGQSAPFNARRN